MQVKTILAGIAAMAISTAAGATSYTSNVTGSGFWGDSSSWTPTGVPGIGDDVLIVAGDQIFVDTGEGITKFEIQATGKLTIVGAGASLAVTGQTASEDINGTVELGDADEPGVISFITAGTHTLVGSGKIQGLYSGSALQVGPAKTLVNKMRIEGTMVMNSTTSTAATFVNFGDASYQGTVVANVSGSPLQFGAYLILDDSTANSVKPRYEALAQGVLRFSRLADGSHVTNNPSLVGDIKSDGCGELWLDADVVTSGNWEFDGVNFDYVLLVEPNEFCYQTSTCISADDDDNGC